MRRVPSPEASAAQGPSGPLSGKQGPSGPLSGKPSAVGASQWRMAGSRVAADGFVGLGADLAPETLVDAYLSGIFPWPHEDDPLPWFSPDPRALIDGESIRVSRSLRRQMRTCSWFTTVDRAFGEVIRYCASRPDGGATWITEAMIEAYGTLHRMGWAHSLEVWDGEALVGGIYGVRVGGCLTAESMFHRRTGASKVALVDLVTRWVEAGGAFVDVQLPTAHLESMGAIAIARRDFIRRLKTERNRVVSMALEPRSVSALSHRNWSPDAFQSDRNYAGQSGVEEA